MRGWWWLAEAEREEKIKDKRKTIRNRDRGLCEQDFQWRLRPEKLEKADFDWKWLTLSFSTSESRERQR